jgi:hypothetical protein
MGFNSGFKGLIRFRSVGDIMIYRTIEGIFSRHIFRKLMIRQSRQSNLLLLIHSQKLFLTKKNKVKNWPCCRKGRTREANIFHALRLVFAWDRTVDFNFHFLNYTCQKYFIFYIHAASGPFISKRSYRASAIVSTFCIVMFIKLLLFCY